MTVATALIASVSVSTGVASAAVPAVPTFPDNIAAFPNRDFVHVDGYTGHTGETATIEVERAGVGVVGSSKAVVSGDPTNAFEINHPGGVCWGAGTGLNVTPDLLPGDVVSISFGGVKVGATTVQDAFVDTDAVQGTGANANKVTVTGHAGPSVIQANTEQRIVDPALLDFIGKRDVRAIPGPEVPAPKGGYTSGLSFGPGNTFTATYTFSDPDGAGPQTAEEVAHIVANPSLGERLLSWEVVDAAGNRQGLTIAEFGEPGGPGMGGCPNGPLQSGPPGPTNVRATDINGSLRLDWDPAVALPGTQPITGYRVEAINKTAVGAEQDQIGKRIAGAGAKGTLITGLVAGAANYDVEVVSVSSVGTTWPAVTAIPAIDLTPPTVVSSVPGGSYPVPQLINLTADEPGAQIFFTVDGTPPVDAVNAVPTATATLFTAPFSVSGNEVVKFAAIDASGNASAVTTLNFTITNAPTPEAPVFGLSDIGVSSIVLNWTPVASVPPITGFGVQVTDALGAPVGALREVAGNVTSLNVTGLNPETLYFFTVAAKNANGYGPTSAPLGLTTLGTVVANAGPDQTVARGTAPKIVNLTGAGSTTVNATYRWTQIDAGPNPVVIAGSTNQNASFTLPLFAYPNTNAPLKFRLTVTVANGASRFDEVLVTPVPDQVAITSAKWKAGDFRVVGTGSLVGASVIVRRGAPNGPVIGAPTLVTAAAPPGIGDINVRLRTVAQGVPGSNPGTIYLESTGGGTTGPFTVANG